jgi:hypothetical protein
MGFFCHIGRSLQGQDLHHADIVRLERDNIDAYKHRGPTIA